MDKRWRNTFQKITLRLLDLATGTADSLLHLLSLPRAYHVTEAVADISTMLAIARKKGSYAEKFN